MYSMSWTEEVGSSRWLLKNKLDRVAVKCGIHPFHSLPYMPLLLCVAIIYCRDE